MANQEQVSIALEGPDQWRVWRTRNPKAILDLSGADLNNVNLQGADLQEANLADCNLQNAKLFGAKLNDADLTRANLENTDLSKADLTNAKVFRAHFHKTNLDGACLIGVSLDFQRLREAEVDLRYSVLSGGKFGKSNLDGIDFSGVNLKNASFYRTTMNSVNFTNAVLDGANLRTAYLQDANFHYASLHGVNFQNMNLQGVNFQEADLSEANLRGTSNLRLDTTFIKGARFSAKPNDPWSVLRSAYTGPKFSFHLLGLIVFMIPYIGKVLYWSSVNRSQEYVSVITENVRQKAIEQGIDEQTIAALGLSPDKLISLTRCMSEVCEQMPVWLLLLGLDQDPLFLLLPVSLLFYNVLRGILTYFTAPLRDEEERSGYTPAWSGIKWWQGYRPLYRAHRIATVFAFIAGAAFLINALHWLWLPIDVPG